MPCGAAQAASEVWYLGKGKTLARYFCFYAFALCAAFYYVTVVQEKAAAKVCFALGIALQSVF